MRDDVKDKKTQWIIPNFMDIGRTLAVCESMLTTTISNAYSLQIRENLCFTTPNHVHNNVTSGGLPMLY
jgi:predicted membrane chloride channel (bestrophin family)